MRFYLRKVRDYWRFMLVPPWQTVRGEKRRQRIHMHYWFLGWVWLLAGFVAGSFASLGLYHWIGADLLQLAGLTGMRTEDGFATVVTFVAGVFVQLFGVLTMTAFIAVTTPFVYRPGPRFDVAINIVVVTAALIPVSICGGFLWWYLASFRSDPALVSTGVLGAVGLKLLSLLVPSVGSVLWNAFKLFVGITPSEARYKTGGNRSGHRTTPRDNPVRNTRLLWRLMFVPPWLPMPGVRRSVRNLWWLNGWLWTIAGFAVGALASHYLYQRFGHRLLSEIGLARPQSEMYFTVGVAFVAGFLVQVLGLTIESILAALPLGLSKTLDNPNAQGPSLLAAEAVTLGGIAFPPAVCAAFIWWYLGHARSDPSLVSAAVFAAVALKLLLTLVSSVPKVLVSWFKHIVGAVPAGSQTGYWVLRRVFDKEEVVAGPFSTRSEAETTCEHLRAESKRIYVEGILPDPIRMQALATRYLVVAH